MSGNFIMRGIVAAAVALAAQAPAGAAQIILNTASVIGDTGGFDSRFTADNIVDRQTGIVYESFADGGYWLNPDGRRPAFITLDLGAAYQLGRFDLFNSRNLGDRGTAQFEIHAANSLATATGPGATGSTLGLDAVTLVSGRLVPVTAGSETPLVTQSFFANDNATAFRYVQFRPLSGINTNYGGAAYGLNEFRVFEFEAPPPPPPAVPEPATWASMIAGFGLMGGALRRTRHARQAVTA